jgi:hypothetical protein
MGELDPSDWAREEGLLRSEIGIDKTRLRVLVEMFERQRGL